MHIISARNVNEAFAKGMKLVLGHGSVQPSRDGPVVTAPMPTVTMYRQPNERVLFHPVRRANPFFHLYEAFWMLAGENNARLLDVFVKNFSGRFAEEGGIQHGAYGHRWRHWFDIDQLDSVVDVLVKNRNSRQVVLQMWDPNADLGNHTLKDRPCNTAIYFRARERGGSWVLDMTVLCRSNDLVMGAYGANCVHMSVLQEYIAVQCDLQVGMYWQVSNDFHVYERDLGRFGWHVADGKVQKREGLPASKVANWHGEDEIHDLYQQQKVSASPLFPDGRVPLLEELVSWLENPVEVPKHENAPVVFDTLLVPMMQAHSLYRDGQIGPAIRAAQTIMPSDWREAAVQWLQSVKKEHG